MSKQVLAACVLALGVTAAQAEAPVGRTFFDDFDGLSTDFWMVSDGWANGSWQNCTWSTRAVDLANGKLLLSFLPIPSEKRDYLCGEIQTYAHFSYGTFEARMKATDVSGLNAAFFTYTGPAHGRPHDEIDFEVLTKNPGNVSLNTYISGEPTHGAVVPVEGGADTGFNTYSFIWEPNRIRFYVNGELMHEATGPMPTTPQKIYFSHWGTDTLTEWMGPFTPPTAPIVMEVDWVAFTRWGDRCQFPQSVLCSLQ